MPAKWRTKSDRGSRNGNHHLPSKNHIEETEEASEVWGCHLALREDGAFEAGVGGLGFTYCQQRWTRCPPLQGP